MQLLHMMLPNSIKKLYPFKSNYFVINELRYHYIDEGSGDVIVMLHGNPTWSFYYRNLINSLRGSYRVIVPDHIGCGLSDKPQNYRYNLENHIQNLTLLLQHLNIQKLTLVVHDWGGPIGFGFAVANASSVEKLIVLNTTATLTSCYPKRILMCKIPILGDVLIRSCNYFARGATLMACVNQDRMTQDVREGYLFPYNSYKNRIANLRFVQDIPLDKNHPSWEVGQSIFDRLKLLEEKPILICWGEKDFCFTKTFLERLITIFPTANVHRIANGGHYVLEDAPDEISELITKFLQQKEAS